MNVSNYYFIIIACLLFNCNHAIKTTYEEKNGFQNAYAITNDTITVVFNKKGGEMTSIKKNGVEYLWQKDSLLWNEQSPILFPIVGKLKDDQYTYNEDRYEMKFHGFGRKENFTILEQKDNTITFQLKSNDNIKAQYPFDFDLRLSYTIKRNTLKVSYNVINLSSTKNMYFSIGAHPGFNCPLEVSHKKNEYQLVFDNTSKPESFDKTGGLFNNLKTQYFEEPGILKIQDTTFNRGALVFNPNPFSKATLVHQPSGKAYLTMSFKDFPFLGIWSARNKNAPFICIEPWYGMADFQSHDKDLTKKEGIQKLNANETFTSSYQIQIH